ncbi:hypothetical protein GMRT_14374 [Giardia muris]|uniref:Uncharacterized protein n=1 Tax=Giardia muris TaxID=5742 RepID=A0A4Z1SQS9_GIAMU|nr:hypothetical protein GMRT_14374 [Giardia muris]|eukprot:TNJ28222.1 hypothetical protein GMRT_14374 [Giardia muris]
MSERPKMSAYLRILPSPEDDRFTACRSEYREAHFVSKLSTSQLSLPRAPARSSRPPSTRVIRFTREVMREERSDGTSRPLSLQGVIGPDETDEWMYSLFLDFYLALLRSGEDVTVICVSGPSGRVITGGLPDATRFFFVDSHHDGPCFITRLLQHMRAAGDDVALSIGLETFGYPSTTEKRVLFPQQHVTTEAIRDRYCRLMLGAGSTMPTLSIFRFTQANCSTGTVLTSELRLVYIPPLGEELSFSTLARSCGGGEGNGDGVFSANSLTPKRPTCASASSGRQMTTLAVRVRDWHCSRAERFGTAQVLPTREPSTSVRCTTSPCPSMPEVTAGKSCAIAFTQLANTMSAVYGRLSPALTEPFLADLRDSFRGSITTAILGVVGEDQGSEPTTRRIIAMLGKAAFLARNMGWTGPSARPEAVMIDSLELDYLRRAAGRTAYLEQQVSALQGELAGLRELGASDVRLARSRAETLAADVETLQQERAALAQRAQGLQRQVRLLESAHGLSVRD